MDSIIKNVGKDYIPLFTKNLYQLFTSAYLSVDQETQARFRRVYDTWPGYLSASELRKIGDFLKPPQQQPAAYYPQQTGFIQPPQPLTATPYHNHQQVSAH
jgi:hypothetical protein